MRAVLSCLLFVVLAGHGIAQKNVLTAGIQFQPIFPVAFLNTADQTVTNSQQTVSAIVSPTFSYSAGMVVRWGFHKRLSLETGLSYVQRNYDLTMATDTFTGKSDFSIVGYEHPIKLLVFVQLSERFYMNAAAGLQLTFFPSDIFTSDTYFKHSGLRLGLGNFLHGGAITNLGFEYRTKKLGFFYLGATYHVPFGDIYRSKFQYISNNEPSEAMPIWLNGSYMTFDIRYFFHSMPLERKDGKKRKSRKERLNDAESED